MTTLYIVFMDFTQKGWVTYAEMHHKLEFIFFYCTKTVFSGKKKPEVSFNLRRTEDVIKLLWSKTSRKRWWLSRLLPAPLPHTVISDPASPPSSSHHPAHLLTSSTSSSCTLHIQPLFCLPDPRPDPRSLDLFMTSACLLTPANMNFNLHLPRAAFLASSLLFFWAITVI